jgi:hypothetical protein
MRGVVALGNVVEAQSSSVGLLSRLAGLPVANSSGLLHPTAYRSLVHTVPRATTTEIISHQATYRERK